MPRLRFLKDRATKEAKPQTFKEGQVVEFPDDPAGNASAQHWLNRGAAVDADAEEEVAPRAARGRKPSRKAAAPEAPDYDDMSVEDLHKLASDREIEGRSGLDKAGLVKALEKADKADAED